jgi:hypothetical protein
MTIITIEGALSNFQTALLFILLLFLGLLSRWLCSRVERLWEERIRSSSD